MRNTRLTVYDEYYGRINVADNVIVVRERQTVQQVIKSIRNVGQKTYYIVVHKQRDDRPMYESKDNVIIVNLNPCEYYVDFENGDDSDDGSREFPFKTIEKINNLGLLPGDKVLFKCGCQWREQLIPSVSGTEYQPIIFTSYGSFDPPLINTTFLVNNGHNHMDGYYCEPDGDFEYRELGDCWWTWPIIEPSYIKITDELSYHGKRCLKMYYDEDGNQPTVGINLNNNWIIKNGVYNLMFAGKTSETGIDIRIKLKDNDDNVKYWDGSQWIDSIHWIENIIPANSDWQEVTVNFSIPEDIDLHYVQLLVRTNTYGTAYVDYFRLISLWKNYDTNIWRIHLGKTQKSSLLFNGKRCNFVDSISDLSTVGDVFYEDGIYYVYLTESPENMSIPIEWCGASHDQSYIGAENFSAVRSLNKDNLIFRNITFRGSSCRGPFRDDNNPSCVLLRGNNLTVEECTVCGSDGEAFRIQGENITLSKNKVSNVGFRSGGVRIDKYSKNIKILNNYFTEVRNSKLDLEFPEGHIIGFFSGVDEHLTIENAIVEGNEIVNCGKYSKNTLIAPYNCKNIIIRFNKVHDNYNVMCVTVGTGSENVKIYCNEFFNNNCYEKHVDYHWGVIQIECCSGANFYTTKNVYVFNNLIYNNNIFFTHDYNFAGILVEVPSEMCTVSDVNIFNNIIVDNFREFDKGYEISTGSIYGTLTNVYIDYNCVYRSSSISRVINWDDIIYDLNHIIGNEAGYFNFDTDMGDNQIVGDPRILFYNGRLGICKNSPCVNEGMFVPALVGIDKKHFQNDLNIGPYSEILDISIGQVTILADSIETIVTHKLERKPDIINLTPLNNLGAASKYWVTDITDNTFKISLDTNPGSDVSFSWKAF